MSEWLADPENPEFSNNNKNPENGLNVDKEDLNFLKIACGGLFWYTRPWLQITFFCLRQAKIDNKNGGITPENLKLTTKNHEIWLQKFKNTWKPGT